MHAFRIRGTFLQHQEQSAASSAQQQAGNHFREGMRMDDQPRIAHHGGQNIAGNNGRFTQTDGETGAEQPQEDRPEGRGERGVATEAGVIQLTNTQTPAHKGQFGGADDSAGDAEQQTPLLRQQPRRFTQHQDNKQRRCAGQQNGAIAKK